MKSSTKNKTQFCCQTCGMQHSKWSGQCSGCHAWNTLSEETVTLKTQKRYQGFAGRVTSVERMTDIQLEKSERISTGIAELDRVLGGGIMYGSAILIGGDPGIGKSTILLQAIAYLSQQFTVLYVTGEESPQQIAERARRLHLSQNELLLFAETEVETIISQLRIVQPTIVVIDSIQTMYTAALSSAPGSVSQVRECAMQLVNYAKQTQTALFLVGHVTKEGNIAGPRVLEHMVDTVLYFEGEQDSRHRLIRAVKNRFGAVNEIGIFAMTEKGLREVTNPSAIFLSHNQQPVAGSIITAIKDGTRPLLVEVQALVDQSHASNPRRLCVGLDTQRLSMLLAILNRHTGVATYNLDVFLNVVGGLQIIEPAGDLPAILAIISSLRNQPLPAQFIAFGELGLAGEIRPVPGGQERLKEADKHGFKIAMVPAGNAPAKSTTCMQVVPIENIKQALDYISNSNQTD